ncbi:BYPASS-related protein [Artemisia annua]|uniref:BYPASS-related protein n=1 Tax=Artemisia annua TaxID=35608 RepID=A0A2U1KSA4_ARTAN|nr:BYPASS-related protein [Artemisia annua]
MSRSEGPHRPFLPIGNPFKMMMHRSSHVPSRVLTAYEKNLAERFRQLKPTNSKDVITFSWMKTALGSICETLDDIRKLIVDLELPICSWDIKWVDMYLDNSLKLLDFCSAYGTDINPIIHKNSCKHRLRFMNGANTKDVLTTQNYKSAATVICKLEETLNLPKIKNIPKAKDLVRAMYGLKVQTMFIFSTFVAAFSSSPKPLVELQVPKEYLWQESFTVLQVSVNCEIKNIYASGELSPLKELRIIDQNVKKLYPLLHDGLGDIKQEVFDSYCSELMENNQKFLTGLDELKSEMDGFFKVVVSGRMALLDNFQQQPPRSGVQQTTTLQKQKRVGGTTTEQFTYHLIRRVGVTSLKQLPLAPIDEKEIELEKSKENFDPAS